MDDYEIKHYIDKYLCDKNGDSKEILSLLDTINDRFNNTLFSLLNDVLWIAINNASYRETQNVFDVDFIFNMILSFHNIARKIDSKKHKEIFGEDWFEKFHEEHYGYKRKNENMPKITPAEIIPIYDEWSQTIIDYLEDNPDKAVTWTTISEEFDWDIHLVRFVFEQMFRDNLLKVNKSKIK